MNPLFTSINHQKKTKADKKSVNTLHVKFIKKPLNKNFNTGFQYWMPVSTLKFIKEVTCNSTDL